MTEQVEQDGEHKTGKDGFLGQERAEKVLAVSRYH